MCCENIILGDLNLHLGKRMVGRRNSVTPSVNTILPKLLIPQPISKAIY